MLNADGQQVPWYVGISSTIFLDGRESKTVSVTMIHPETPSKGSYEQLFGLDVDNGVSMFTPLS